MPSGALKDGEEEGEEEEVVVFLGILLPVVPLQGQGGATIVDMMGIGQEIARLVIGKTNATVVGNEVTLSGIVEVAQGAIGAGLDLDQDLQYGTGGAEVKALIVVEVGLLEKTIEAPKKVSSHNGIRKKVAAGPGLLPKGRDGATQ